MAKLGECLVFYLKYPTEMRKIEADQDLEGLVDAETTKKMVKQVAAQRDLEVGEFLEECGKLVARHFSSIGNPDIAKRGRVETAKKNWSVSYGIWPANGRFPVRRDWRMRAGIDITKDAEAGKFQVIGWLWSRGEDEAEKRMRVVLQNKLTNDLDLKALGYEEGYVPVTSVPLTPPTEGFDLDSAPILEELNKAFAKIKKDEFTTLYPR